MNYFIDTEFLEGTQKTFFGKSKPTVDLIENKYYLYRHIRKDKNEVFYIGIGTKRRNADYTRAYSKHLRNNWWNNIEKNTEIQIDILFEDNSRKVIEEKEIEFIKLYGRKNLKLGTLVNLTDGGEGSSNTVVSDYTKKLRSLFFKNNKYRLNKKHSEEVKLNMSINRKGENHPMFGKKHKQSTIEKFKIAQTGTKKSEVTKQKHRDRCKLPNQCNKKPCMLINLINGETWEAESVFKLSLKCPLSKSTLNKLKQGLNVTKKYKDYKFINL